MKTYAMKRVVVGILLVILTLGFCVVGTGAAKPDQMMGGPMDQQGFGPGGQGGPSGRQNGPMGQQGFGPGENFNSDSQSFGGDFAPDGATPPEDSDFSQDGASFPGGFGPMGGRFSDGETNLDGQFSSDGHGGPDGQRGFGGRGGFGRDGGFRPMADGVREAIEALDDGETKSALEALYENVHTAMEALMNADDDTREAAQSAADEARDALSSALAAAGIDASMMDPPEKPEGDENMGRPERPENDDQNRPENGGGQKSPDFLIRENLENIDLDDEEQVQDLFQRFLAWIRGSSNI